LIEAGYNAVVLDNLHNSSTEAIRRIEGIVNKEVPFEKVDLTELDAVKAVFAKYPIDSVIHFAGLKVCAHDMQTKNRPLEKVERSLWSTIA
jgi:UDP-glucose 4-epimerase